MVQKYGHFGSLKVWLAPTVRAMSPVRSRETMLHKSAAQRVQSILKDFAQSHFRC